MRLKYSKIIFTIEPKYNTKFKQKIKILNKDTTNIMFSFFSLKNINFLKKLYFKKNLLPY